MSQSCQRTIDGKMCTFDQDAIYELLQHAAPTFNDKRAINGEIDAKLIFNLILASGACAAQLCNLESCALIWYCESIVEHEQSISTSSNVTVQPFLLIKISNWTDFNQWPMLNIEYREQCCAEIASYRNKQCSRGISSQNNNNSVITQSKWLETPCSLFILWNVQCKWI